MAKELRKTAYRPLDTKLVSRDRYCVNETACKSQDRRAAPPRPFFESSPRQTRRNEAQTAVVRESPPIPLPALRSQACARLTRRKKRDDGVSLPACEFLARTEELDFPDKGEHLQRFLAGGDLEMLDIEDIVRVLSFGTPAGLPAIAAPVKRVQLSGFFCSVAVVLWGRQAEKVGRQEGCCPYFASRDLMVAGAGLILVRARTRVH